MHVERSRSRDDPPESPFGSSDNRWPPRSQLPLPPGSSSSSEAPAWRDVVIIADFSTLSSLAEENWNFSAMHPLNHVPLSTMEEKALWQYTRFVYANQVDDFTFDTVLSGIAERIEEHWQISLRTDDLEVRYDENNGLEVFQVTRHLLDQCKMSEIKRDATMAHPTWPPDARPSPSGSASSQSVLPPTPPQVAESTDLSGISMDHDTTYGAADSVPTAPFISDTTDDDRAPLPVNPAGMKRIPKHQLTFAVCEWNGGTQSDLQVGELNLETNSFREHQVEFFFYKFVGDWHAAQKKENYWRQHYGLATLPVDPVPESATDNLTTGVLPDVSTLDPATVYAAQLMTVCCSLTSATSPDQHRQQLLRLIQDSEFRNLFTPIDLNTLATQIHQLADLLTEANSLPMEVHLTPADAAQL
eukprot:s1430_g15.t1